MMYSWDSQTYTGTGQSIIEDCQEAYRKIHEMSAPPTATCIFHSYKVYKMVIRKYPELFPFGARELRRYNRKTKIIGEYYGVTYYVTPKFGK